MCFLTVQGGAIYASHGEDDRVTIDNCTFTGIAAKVRDHLNSVITGCAGSRIFLGDILRPL
jgi:hypothetical protein